MARFPSVLPEPLITPLRGGATARWGVLAPGRIANDWVTTLHANTDQRVHAVASSDLARAARFAASHGIPRHHGSYEGLLQDDAVDIVYIPALNTEHKRLALLSIAAGKHVLIEKPIAMNAAEAQEIATAAQAAGVFAMEAMWSRFLPQSDVIARLLADGELGAVRWAAADFGSHVPFDPANRVFDPRVGGGALLDLGVYSVWFTHFALGAPSSVIAAGTLAPTGVDAQASLLLDYDGAAQAQAAASILARTPTTATIAGELGCIEVDSPFPGPGGFRLVGASSKRELRWTDTSPLHWRDGLAYQAVAVAQHVADGLLESPLHPLSTSIAVMRVLDDARAQLGAL